MLVDAVLAFDVVGLAGDWVIEKTVFLEAVAEKACVVPVEALFALGIPGSLLE